MDPPQLASAWLEAEHRERRGRSPASNAIGLVLAALVTSVTAVANAAEEGAADQSTVSDGAQGLRVVVERPSQALDRPSATAAPSVPAPARQAWRRHSGGRVTYEVRGQASMLKLPEQTIGLTGFCSTTLGVANPSIYGQTARAQGIGFGGGFGGRLGLMHVSPLKPDAVVSWWAFHLGTGLDLQAFHVRAPTDIRPLAGELCSLVARATHEVRYESMPLLLLQVPVNLGGNIAFGKLVDETTWRGVVVGLAWTPSFIHVGAFSRLAMAHVNPLGVELTLDFAALHARTSARRPEAHLRLALFLAPPTNDRQPAIGSLSLGAVWY